MAKKIRRFFLKIQNFFDGIHIPVLGISLWKMFGIYSNAIFKNPLGRQAASISWNFFSAFFR
jgi:membrane protein